MVTIRDVEKRLEHQQRLEMAGITVPDPGLGPAVLLWTRKRDGAENWEVLPKWVANLVVSDLHNDGSVERAAIYHKLPKKAPLEVAKLWLRLLAPKFELTPCPVAG